MKLAYIAFLSPHLPHLLRKFDQQIQSMRRLNPDTRGIVMGPPGGRYGRFVFQYPRIPWEPRIFFAACANIVETLQPDMVYLRYFAFNQYTVKFMERYGDRVVFEHHTIEPSELEGKEREDDLLFGPKILGMAAGCVGVTQEIAAFESNRAEGGPIPCLALGNGIDPNSVPPLKFDLPKDAIHLICAANFSAWHGIDRLLRGMALYSGKERFILHLAGNGVVLDELIALTKTLHLEHSVIFHGPLDHAQLHRLACRCHVGVGTLGVHRKGLTETTSLKHREYCLQGLPFILSSKDVDIPENSPFIRTFPQDDSPIAMEAVADLARSVEQEPQMRSAMHAFARQHLSWDAKSADLARFLHMLHEKRRAKRPEHDTAQSRPLVSVVMRVHSDNPSRLTALAEMFGQVRNQGNAAFELILVNSGDAADMTHELEMFRRKHPEIQTRVLHAAKNSIAEARNAGIDAARGIWIFLLENEDRPRADFLRLALEECGRHPEINVIYSYMQPDGASGALVKTEEYSWEYPADRDIFPESLLFRKQVWEDAGKYEAMQPWGMISRLFWMRAARAAILARRIPYPCLIRGPENAGSSKSAAENPLQKERIAKEAAALLLTQMTDADDVEAIIQAHAELAKHPGMSPESEQRIDLMLRHFPEHSLPYVWKGLFHEGKGEFDKALVCYLNATAREAESDWQAHLRLYLLYEHAHNAAKAQRHKEECARRNPMLAFLLTVKDSMAKDAQAPS